MEEVVRFAHGLNGILDIPSAQRFPMQVLFINGWTGNCAGPHRLLTEWARTLSSHGIASLRFDFSGRGDSSGDEMIQSVFSMHDDTLLAADYLRNRFGNASLVPIAICSGSLVALQALRRLESKYLILLSPSSEITLDFSQVRRELGTSLGHLSAYARKLLRADSWRRIFAGEVDWRVIVLGVLRLRRITRLLKYRLAPPICRPKIPHSSMQSPYWTDLLEGYRGKLLILLGALDPKCAQIESEFSKARDRYNLDIDLRIAPGVDSLFSNVVGQRSVVDESARWLLRRASRETQ